MSAVLPGLGQAYNHKYWKIPVIYAGAGLSYYAFSVNQNLYLKYRKAYSYRTDEDATTIDEYNGKYSEDQLKYLKDYYHRNRDLGLIWMSFFYIGNVIDALVDAHLYKFDVSDNLSFRFLPQPVGLASTIKITGGFVCAYTF